MGENLRASVNYEIDFQNGVWGMWAESYSFEQLERLCKESLDERAAALNGFLPIVEVTIPMLIGQLPKQRKFFSFPINTPPLKKETDRIFWVGHLGCFPKRERTDRLLASGIPKNLMIAVCDIIGKVFVLTVHILKDNIVPVNCCCDISRNK